MSYLARKSTDFQTKYIYIYIYIERELRDCQLDGGFKLAETIRVVTSCFATHLHVDKINVKRVMTRLPCHAAA